MSSCNPAAAETDSPPRFPPLPHQKPLSELDLTRVWTETSAGCPALSSPPEAVFLHPLDPVATVKSKCDRSLKSLLNTRRARIQYL